MGSSEGEGKGETQAERIYFELIKTIQQMTDSIRMRLMEGILMPTGKFSSFKGITYSTSS